MLINVPPRHSKVKNHILGGGEGSDVRVFSKTIFSNLFKSYRLREACPEYIERGDCRSRKLNVDKEDPRS